MDNFNDNQKLTTSVPTLRNVIETYRTDAHAKSFPVDPKLTASQQVGVCTDPNMPNSYKKNIYA